MGFKHQGPQGNRRIVPDEEARAVLEQIRFARDALGLSWDNVSDHVDAYLAEKHARPRTLRCNRGGSTGWTKASCRDWYLKADLETPEDDGRERLFRRCEQCNRSLPVEDFARHGKYRRRACRSCRATRTFRLREEEHRREVAASIRRLTLTLRERGAESAAAAKAYEQLISKCGNVKTAARDWKELADEAERTSPGSRRVLGFYQGLGELLRACAAEEKKVIAKLPELTDEELDDAIMRYVVKQGLLAEEEIL